MIVILTLNLKYRMVAGNAVELTDLNTGELTGLNTGELTGLNMGKLTGMGSSVIADRSNSSFSVDFRFYSDSDSIIKHWRKTLCKSLASPTDEHQTLQLIEVYKWWNFNTNKAECEAPAAYANNMRHISSRECRRSANILAPAVHSQYTLGLMTAQS